jgi:CelD/BcsL family acetyltransferase involved in cellulose biosynthesis
MGGENYTSPSRLKVTLFQGRQAERLLSDAAFVADWQALARKTDMVTVIQEPPFVLTWYRQYADVFRPMLVVGRDSEGTLVGLLPLAYSDAEREMAHAGAWQGEYHGWVCTPEAEREFLPKAIIAIQSHFPLRTWTWRWMPPGANRQWLQARELRRHGIYVSTIEQEPPVLDLNDEDRVRKIRRNKSLRAKMNRYARRGALRLERITSPERAAEIFDDLILQTDFRQMAVHGEKPFASDPHKKNFYLARLQFPQNNHFTVLWWNEQPLAYHFGACDDSTVYLGLTGYDPRESKNSPGILLMVQLIERLREEGFRYFDLTPGEDEYKDRLGSHRRKVVEPTFYFNRRDKLTADLKKVVRVLFKSMLQIVGIEPKKVKRNLGEWTDFLVRLHTSGFGGAAKKMKRLLFGLESWLYLEFNRQSQKANGVSHLTDVHVQQYQDLFLFRSKNPWRTQQDVLLEAIWHFSRGERLFTLVENGALVGFGWLGMLASLRENWARNPAFESDRTKNVSVLHDFYFRDLENTSVLFSALISEMVSQTSQEGGEKVALLVPENALEWRKAAEELGFVPVRKIIESRWLGKNRLVVQKVEPFRKEKSSGRLSRKAPVRPAEIVSPKGNR